MDKPFVSIIVPTRNRAFFTQNILRNFARQTYPKSRMELLICDDSDKEGMVDEIPNKRNIKYKYLNNRNDDGLQIALSIGAKRKLLCEQAKGDIIFQMDDDDIYPRTSVSHVVASLSSKRKKVACLDIVYAVDIREQMICKLEFTAPTHIVGFKRSILKSTGFNERDWISEETSFLKECYEDWVSTLNPLKTLLMICHGSNTSDKSGIYSSETKTDLLYESFVKTEEDLSFLRQHLPNHLGFFKPVNFMSLMAEARRKEMEREH